ncbi:MAG: hypothetical protein WCW26_04065 [Candidatus Buchananbacteria bacterium]
MQTENDQDLGQKIAALEKLLQQNLEVSLEIQKTVKALKNWIIWQRAWLVVKILVIVVPTVLGIIYLPGLLKQSLGNYQQLLNSSLPNSALIDQLNQIKK